MNDSKCQPTDHKFTNMYCTQVNINAGLMADPEYRLIVIIACEKCGEIRKWKEEYEQIK